MIMRSSKLKRSARSSALSAARGSRRGRRHDHARTRHPHDPHPQARERALPPRRPRRVQSRQVDVRERAARRRHPPRRHHAHHGVDQPRRVCTAADGARRPDERREPAPRAGTDQGVGHRRGQSRDRGLLRRGRLPERATPEQRRPRRYPGRERPQRAARRGHVRLRAARRRRGVPPRRGQALQGFRPRVPGSRRLRGRARSAIFVLGRWTCVGREARPSSAT